MMTLVVLGLAMMLLAFSPWNMGVAIALSASVYTLRSAFEFPGVITTALVFAPLLFILRILPGAIRSFRFAYFDVLLSIYFSFMFLSILFTGAFGASVGELFVGLASTALFYALGRLYKVADPVRTWTFGFGLVGALPIVGVCYLLSDNMYIAWDRQVFDNATPVGLAQVLNLWVISSAAAVFWIAGGGKETKARSQMSGPTLFVALFGGAWASYLLLQNGTRGALLVIVMTVGIFFAASIFRRMTALRMAILLVALVGAGILILTLPDILKALSSDPTNRYYKMLAMIGGLFGIEPPVTIYDTSTMERAVLREGAFRLFTESPLFGCGFGCTTMYVGNYPHSMFLEIAAEAGLIGVLLVAPVILKAGLTAVRILFFKATSDLFVHAMAMLSLLLHFQFSYSVGTAKILFFFIGVVLTDAQAEAEARHRRKVKRNAGTSASSGATRPVAGRPAVANSARRSGATGESHPAPTTALRSSL